MPSRREILTRASEDCMKELYSFVEPKVTWSSFVEQNKEYSKKYKTWELERKTNPNYIGKSITECIGPRPYEFYYLPKDIMKDICDSYIRAYKMDNQQELLDTIETLKNYCKEPIVDKYIDDYTDEYGNHHPGYRSYDHPDNLEEVLTNFLNQKYNSLYNFDKECSKEILNKFFEFLDMAGNFFNWNSELNSFNTTVYLGPSPNSNKESVIENWKRYRGKDIKIDEGEIKKEYYGKELD